MSLYRQAGRVGTRTLALGGIAVLVIGLLAGFVLGRVTGGEPSLADQVRDLRVQVRPADQGLELTATEYTEAVRGGQVTKPTEYDAARADIARVGDTLRPVRADLRALSPGRAGALEAAVAAVEDGVRTRVEPAEVQQRSDAARRALAAMFGG